MDRRASDAENNTIDLSNPGRFRTDTLENLPRCRASPRKTKRRCLLRTTIHTPLLQLQRQSSQLYPLPRTMAADRILTRERTRILSGLLVGRDRTMDMVVMTQKTARRRLEMLRRAEGKKTHTKSIGTMGIMIRKIQGVGKKRENGWWC